MIIIAGIGLNSFASDKIKKIILAGVDYLRYNLSYNSIDDNIEKVKLAHQAVDELNSGGTKILIDFPINKIRLGDFDLKIFAVREGESYIFKSAGYTTDCNLFIPVQIQRIGEQAHLNQVIAVGDGEVAVLVTDIINAETIKCKILNKGIIQYCKAFNIRNNEFNLEALEHTYKTIIEKIDDFSPHAIAISYIHKNFQNSIRVDLEEMKRRRNIKIILKIEGRSGITDIENIAQDKTYDMVMIDRGELGVNTKFEEIGLIENMLITATKKYNKPVIISTNILESTIDNYIPNRSEISALTELIARGISGIMLCQETTIGLRPAHAIKVAKRIIEATEKYKGTIRS